MRWDPYHLFEGATFTQFWRDRINEKNKVLLIVGRGFDTRMPIIPSELASYGANLSIWLLKFGGNTSDDSAQDLIQANLAQITKLIPFDRIEEVEIKTGFSDGHSVTGKNTKTAIENLGDISKFDDLIVDISAIPRIIAMTSIAKLLYYLDNLEKGCGKCVNLHVVTAESVSKDVKISVQLLQNKASQVFGFSGEANSESTREEPRILFPVLGENQTERLKIIHDQIRPDEICPVVPFPSIDPRRGDNIIMEHRQILFDELQVEPKNILRVHEFNPFEAYKQLFLAIERYRVSLSSLGSYKAFVAPISSKLLSVASLLASYDHKYRETAGPRVKIGIPYVEVLEYGELGKEKASPDCKLYSMWIKGSWE